MYKEISKLINNKILMIAVMIIAIAAVVCFPGLKDGVYGFSPDVTYHMFRIEGLKDCILNGEFPTRIYRNFFDGYGYGSPMFYPDIFLLPAVVLRMIGIGVNGTYKIFLLLITIIASLTTYYSAKVITSEWRLSCLATYMIMLSQFYLANITCRAGLSEYMGYIFMPLVFAGTYDFFCNKGKRVYLLGIGFGGMILTHTLLSFLGGIVVACLFIIGFIIDIKNKNLRERKKQCLWLVITAVITILVVGFYLFPMLEQMMGAELAYKIPWTFVGNNTQPFFSFFNVNGYFELIAYVGIGIPLLLLSAIKIFFGYSKKIWCEVFFYLGVVLFLSTTRIVPWHLLNNTFLNSIQFTFRLYPYAIFALTIGGIMQLKVIHDKNIVKYIVPRAIIVFAALSVMFGLWENYFLIKRSAEPDFITNFEKINMETTYMIGEGKEWIPIKAKDIYVNWSKNDKVKAGDRDIDYNRNGKEIEFESVSDANEYICPLTYYKGYKAQLEDQNNNVYDLAVEESDTGQVKVVNSTSQSGMIKVFYANTVIQTVSLIISCIVICAVLIILIVYYILKKRGHRIAKSNREDKEQ